MRWKINQNFDPDRIKQLLFLQLKNLNKKGGKNGFPKKS
jgi:hypothetical protein